MDPKGQKYVAYIASPELIKYASLLPCNKHRSQMVHSLINSLGLLRNDATATPPDQASTRHRRRIIKVIKPERASAADLAAYHDKDYVDFLLNHAHSTLHVSPNPGGASWRGHVYDKGEFGGSLEEALAGFGLEDDCPPFLGLPEYASLVAGASITAAKALAHPQIEVSIAWDGGRHHAKKSQASGFCYVADCVLAILTLKKLMIPIPLSEATTTGDAGSEEQARTRKPRIMYLDLDLHFSDGVHAAFASSSASSARPLGKSAQILTFSIHHSSPGFFPPSTLSSLPSLPTVPLPHYSSSSSSSSPSPSSPPSPPPTPFDPYTLSLPLHPGASLSTFRRIWPIVESVRSAFQPDFVVLQCGVDTLAGDPCGTFNWSLSGGDSGSRGGGGGETGEEIGSLGWCVDRVVNVWEGKKILLGGGGYHNANTARAWAYFTSIATGQALDVETPIPDHDFFPAYKPSFTLDVQAGNMQDLNNEEYLRLVEERFERVVEALMEARL